MNAMKRNSLFITLLLALFTGQAEAQRRLPGMKAVRFTTEMADGFYSRANRHRLCLLAGCIHLYREQKPVDVWR